MKHIRLMPLILILALTLTSCAALSSIGQIEDTNGEDTTLVTVTEEELFGSRPTSATFVSSLSAFGRGFRFSVQKLSGVYSFDPFRVTGSKLTITTTATLASGNLRIVLLCDGEYAADIPLAADHTFTIDNPDGLYEVRIGGESAEMTLELSYTVE